MNMYMYKLDDTNQVTKGSDCV